MANDLNIFVEKTKILASKVNENFENLQANITEVGNLVNDELGLKIDKVKEDLLVDINSVKEESNSKLDPNLESISASGKNKITSFLMPDYSKKITIATSSTSSGSTPYTVEKNGHIIGHTYNDNGSSYVSINGIEFHVGRQSNDGEIGNAFYFPVSKGDVISWRRTGTHNKLAIYFLPCIGEE